MIPLQTQLLMVETLIQENTPLHKTYDKVEAWRLILKRREILKQIKTNSNTGTNAEKNGK